VWSGARESNPVPIAYKTTALPGELAPSWPPRSRTALYPLIRRASSPAESWPAEGGGVDPPGGKSCAGVQSPLPRRRRTFLKRKKEDPNPSQLPGPPAFETGPAARQVHLPRAESGELESHALRRALVSSEARPLTGSLSMVHREGVEPSRPKAHGSGPCAAADYATSACERLDGLEPPAFPLRKGRSAR
jgi:hypothetical protein